MKNPAIIIAGFLVITCSAPCKLAAQSECSIKHFNTANGLSQNTITGMAFDSIGYLWLGTQNGLIRYDGLDFKTYLSDRDNTSANGSNNVLTVSPVLPGKKVLIRMRGGIVYSTENGRPVLYSDAIKNTTYYYGFGGRFPNLSLFDQFNLPITELTEKYKWNTETRVVLPVNTTDFIVLGKNDSSLFYYKEGVKQREIRINRRFGWFLKSGAYNLMLDDKFRLCMYDSLSGSFNEINVDWSGIRNETGSNKGLVFLWDKMNDQSYCFYNSTCYLLRFDAAGHRMKFMPQFSTGTEVHFWTNIVFDTINSTYFLSTFNEGLFQVKLKQIKTINVNEKTVSAAGGNNAVNYALLSTSDSTLLTTGGLELTGSVSNVITIKRKGNISGNKETIGRIGDTAILCVQHNQVVYYSKADGYLQPKIFNETFNRDNNSFITLLNPEGDSVWVCSDAGIFSLKQGTVRTLVYRKSDQQTLYFGPHLFYRISEKEVLFSNNLGLFKLSTLPPYTVDTFPQMKDKEVSSIVKYKDALLLSVYKYGLVVFNNNVFYKVPGNEDQPALNFCHSLYVDKNENVWMTTDNGLFRSSISSVIESALKPGIQPFFFSYGENDGIKNTEFTGGGTPSYAALANGQLFFPSADGVVTFNTEELSSGLLKRPIGIEKIQEDDKETGPLITDSIYLRPDHKLLGIDLSVPHFGEPENLLLEYNMDNEGWKKIPAIPSRRVMLYDISSGYHQLIFRKRTGFSNTDYVYKNLIIYRQKHIYQQAWFYVAAAAVFILLVLSITRFRTASINRNRRQLQARVNEQTSELSKNVETKELLINIISADMITPLKHVSVMAGELRNDIERYPGKETDVLSDIKATSDKILAGSQGIINYMKYNSSRVALNKQSENLYDKIEEVCETLLSAAREKNISIINKISRDIFVEMDEHIFGIILTNIISNAVRYSGGNSIEVVSEAGSELKAVFILKIKDNGIGISDDIIGKVRELLNGNLQVIKAINKRGIGLTYILISELIRIHGLSVSVESGLNNGTTVSIAIPNNRDSTEPDIFYSSDD